MWKLKTSSQTDSTTISLILFAPLLFHINPTDPRSAPNCHVLTHIAPLDGLSQHFYNVVSFTVRGLEAFCPAHQCTLEHTKVRTGYMNYILLHLLIIITTCFTMYIFTSKLCYVIHLYTDLFKAPHSDVHTYSVNSSLLAGEREGKASGKVSVLHPHVVQEVADTLSYMIEQLKRQTKKSLQQVEVCLDQSFSKSGPWSEPGPEGNLFQAFPTLET